VTAWIVSIDVGKGEMSEELLDKELILNVC
jgi:hypothetical protein